MVRVRLLLEVLLLLFLGTLDLAQLSGARVELLDGSCSLACRQPRLTEQSGGRDEFAQVLVAVLLEEAEVDVGSILGVC